MDLAALITKILERHSFPSIQEGFQPTPGGIRVRIGFVGEFSSGKSTLINAMVGSKVLPSRADPTTAAIVTLEAVEGLASLERFRVESDGCQVPIKALEFSEIATGRRPGVLEVHVPPSETMRPGLRVIDSPGLNAPWVGHSELTMAQLTTLDGLVLCLQPNLGTLPGSLQGFLAMVETASLQEHLLFVVTFGDLHPEPELAHIINNVEAELRKSFPSLQAAPRIVVTDALGALEGNADGIRMFQQAFRTEFMDQADLLQRERYNKHLAETAVLLAQALQCELEALAIDSAGFDRQELELKGQIEAVRRKKFQEHDRLDTWQQGLTQAFHDQAKLFISRFGHAEVKDLEGLAAEFEDTLQKLAEAHVQAYACEEQAPLPTLPRGQAAALTDALRANAKHVDHLVTLSTLVAAAVTAGMAGAGVLAAEGAGDLAAGSQVLAKEFAKQGAKESGIKAAEAALKGAAGKRFLKSALAVIGDAVQKANPLEMAGSVARGMWNDHEAAQQIPQLASRLSLAIVQDLKTHLDRTCFRSLEQALEAASDGLAQAREARSLALEELLQRKECLKADLRLLASARSGR